MLSVSIAPGGIITSSSFVACSSYQLAIQFECKLTSIFSVHVPSHGAITSCVQMARCCNQIHVEGDVGRKESVVEAGRSEDISRTYYIFQRRS